MKLFNKIRTGLSRLPRRTVLTIAGFGMLLAATPIAVTTFAEFYPDRPAYDYNKECNPNDADKYDRCGSLEGPVFNSFINTPSYGDERAFVDARRTDQTAAGSFKNVLPDVTGGAKEVVVRMYVHNNANQSTNASGVGVAKDTKVRVALPTGTAQALRARGYISASNAAMVEDTVDFTAGEEFSVSYVPGSATLYDNDNFAAGVKLSDAIVTTGAPIGSDSLNGEMKGCFEYEAVVQIKVKVTPKQNPSIKLTKEVRKKGTTEWKKEVNAKPGEEVEWLLTTENTGSAVLNNNIIRDVLPPHVELTSGSVKWIDASQNAVQTDKPLFDGGINVGNYAPGSGFYMTFATKVKGDFDPCQVRVRNVAYVKATETPEIQDDADVIITRENCDETTPSFSCELLSKTLVSGRTYKFTAKAVAQGGATVKQYRYEFTGSNYKQEAVTNAANGEIQHTFPASGSYTARVTVDFTVDGQVKSHTADTCVQPVNIDVPPTPTTLPSTGPGEVVGIFAAVTIAGSMAHRFILGRRFNV